MATAVAGQKTDLLTNLESVSWIRAEDLQLPQPPPKQKGAGGKGRGEGGGDAADLSSAALGPALRGPVQGQESCAAYLMS